MRTSVMVRFLFSVNMKYCVLNHVAWKPSS